MIKVSIFYPNNGGHFDMDYYLNKHMPMSIERLSAHPGFKSVSVERGIGGGAPNTEPEYIAICHYVFDSVESYIAAFTPHEAILRGDMPNYTDIEIIFQFSEIMISR